MVAGSCYCGYRVFRFETEAMRGLAVGEPPRLNTHIMGTGAGPEEFRFPFLLFALV